MTDHDRVIAVILPRSVVMGIEGDHDGFVVLAEQNVKVSDLAGLLTRGAFLLFHSKLVTRGSDDPVLKFIGERFGKKDRIEVRTDDDVKDALNYLRAGDVARAKEHIRCTYIEGNKSLAEQMDELAKKIVHRLGQLVYLGVESFQALRDEDGSMDRYRDHWRKAAEFPGGDWRARLRGDCGAVLGYLEDLRRLGDKVEPGPERERRTGEVAALRRNLQLVFGTIPEEASEFRTAVRPPLPKEVVEAYKCAHANLREMRLDYSEMRIDLQGVTVLLVDDIAPPWKRALERKWTGFKILDEQDVGKAVARIEEDKPDVLLLDVVFGEYSDEPHDAYGAAVDVLRAIKARYPHLPVIMFTACMPNDQELGDFIRAGAYSYRVKTEIDYELFGLEIRNAARLHRTAKEKDEAKLLSPLDDEAIRKAGGFAGLVGVSDPMVEVYHAIHDVAGTDRVTVLVTGESGTGKELVARAIHEQSRRLGRPFVAVNCAALPEALTESELFGHVRGAFTDAKCDQEGKFEAAHEGTIFLDEIGDMSPAAQAKVLRVLEDKTITRVGGNKPITVDVRIIAASNKDLKAIARREFRDDLYHRLNGFTIRLPPLRERRSDIPLLCKRFIRRNKESEPRAFGWVNDAVPRETLDVLMQYVWPGNVRQLESHVQKKMTSARTAHDRWPRCLQEPPDGESGQGEEGWPAGNLPHADRQAVPPVMTVESCVALLEEDLRKVTDNGRVRPEFDRGRMKGRIYTIYNKRIDMELRRKVCEALIQKYHFGPMIAHVLGLSNEARDALFRRLKPPLPPLRDCRGEHPAT